MTNGSGQAARIGSVTGSYPILESLDSPRALRDMDSSGLRSLAEEMRRALVDHVSVTGGHLCVKGRFGWGFVEGDGSD